jgi:hypothetical protein
MHKKNATKKTRIVICKSDFLDFVYRLYLNKITFRKLDLLLSSGKKGRTKTVAVGPLIVLASNLAQLGFLSFLFYLKTEEDPASETL